MSNNKELYTKNIYSFGQWCEDHARLDLLKRWDYKMNNGLNPFEIGHASRKKVWLKCPRGIHPSEQKTLHDVTKFYGSSLCNRCNSFAQWGIDNIDVNFIDKYWSDKNDIDPFTISKCSNKKVWIKCQKKDYHPDYQVKCCHFVDGHRCPYCSRKKLVKEDSLGFLYPKSLEMWVEKKTSPYDYKPMSSRVVYWKCPKHGEFRKAICDMVRCDFSCPKCSKESKYSKLQHKVFNYIHNLFNDVRHEYQCTIIPINPNNGYKLPYDNEIVDLKLIIQVNGLQHYSVNSYKTLFDNHRDTPEEQFKHRQHLDKFKKDYAISHGYHYLVIPYWTDDKQQTWKKLIDRKIEELR